MLRIHRSAASFVVVLSFLVANSAFAAFHLTQVEQIIGGVNGDLTAQAIQLRMRSVGQSLVSAAEVCVADANDANPIRIGDITTNVPIGLMGRRVLIASANFLNKTSPTTVPDFTMSALIPMSYLSAGTLTFRADGVTPCTVPPAGPDRHPLPPGLRHSSIMAGWDDPPLPAAWPATKISCAAAVMGTGTWHSVARVRAYPRSFSIMSMVPPGV